MKTFPTSDQKKGTAARILHKHRIKIKIKRYIVMQHKIALRPQDFKSKIEVSGFTVLFEMSISLIPNLFN